MGKEGGSMAVGILEELIVLEGGEMGKRIQSLLKKQCHRDSFQKPSEK